MASLSKYFIQDESNLLVRNDCIVFGNNYRFSVLTERLIRLEYSPSGKFEDRASELVINRNFPKPNFTYQKNKGILEIKTRYFTLNYLENKPFKGSKVTPGNTLNIKLNNTNNFWYYNHPECQTEIEYKIDHIRDDGTAKIHSISSKTNEICYRADISKFKLENI